MKDHAKEMVRIANEREILRIRKHIADHPDDDFSKANQHLLGDGQSWHCFGTIEMTGFIWWAMSVQIVFTDFSHGFVFSASGGPDWAVAAFAGDVAGSFVVDPNTLVKGKYRFSLSGGGLEVGGVTFSMYDTNRKYLGQMYGVVAGGGGLSLSGTGSLTY